MGIPVDWKPERAVQAKLGIYTKDYTPDKLKTRKGDLGKKGILVDRKHERAVQAKIQD